MSNGTAERDEAERADARRRDARRRRRGIALMSGALLCFACLDTCAKYLNGHMDTLEVVWTRYASAFLLTSIVMRPSRLPALARTGRLGLQLGRSLLLLASTALNFIALRYLQLDQTISIGFSTPFFVAALAGPLLGEWIGWRRWTAIVVGFGGVLIVLRPGLGMHPAALLSLTSALAYAFYNIATRVLARTDSTETTLFYSNFTGFAVMSIPVWFVWTNPSDPIIIGLMVAIGAFGSFGHFLLIAAHRLAPASILAPFIYTELVWMAGSGYLFFGQVPDRYTLAGAAVVIASGLYLLYRERVRGSR